MDVLELLRGQLDDNFIQQLTRHIGADNPEQTEAAASGIISTLVAGLSKNAEQPEGANALVSAIERDHDGSLLDDVSGFLFGNKQVSNPKTLNGAGILEHILGGKQNNVQDMLGKVTGLNKSQIFKLMIALAPMVLAALGKARNQQQQTSGGFDIGDLLRGTVKSQTNQRQEFGLLQRFLDKDGDGSVMDDLADIGMNVFLKRR
jgi:hypothetical protein